MKVAITGHTAGIGKRLIERLGTDARGFSRSNGYDITNAADRRRIIDKSDDCDIFINNATAEFGQVQLFIELFKRWRNTNKTIINVGSRIAEAHILPANLQDLLDYQSNKLILKEMSARVQGTCSVKYKWFGYVGTDAILKKYPHFTVADYITEDAAVDILLS